MNESPSSSRSLYELLPIVLRRRDVGRADRPPLETVGNHALRAVVAVAQAVFDALETDVTALYDDWFVETCASWVLPYIAELVAIDPQLSVQRPAADLRRLVANVVWYRKFKGTSAALEAVAQDVLGWPVRVVESRSALARTPYVGAFEPGALGTLDVGDARATSEIGTPFERAARTIDVRGLAADARGLAARGVQRIGTPREIALSTWRYDAMQLWMVDAHPVSGHASCYTFDPLGMDRRLVNPPVYCGTPRERAAPVPLRNAVLAEELAGHVSPQYFASDPVAFEISVERADGQRTTLTSDSLATTSLALWKPPVADTALVDVERGRFVLDPTWKRPRATFAWATGGNVGGGPYRRFVEDDAGQELIVTRDGPPGPATFASLDDAVKAIGALRPADGVVRITIADNGTYAAPSIPIALAGGASRIVLRAWGGPRPVVRGDITLDVQVAGARMRLEGIVLDGVLAIDAAPNVGDVQLEVEDATIVPRRHTVLGTSAALLDARVLLQRSICGRIALPELGTQLSAQSSILDGAGGVAIEGPRGGRGPDTALRSCTVLGDVRVYAADVRGSIVDGTLTVDAGDRSRADHSAIRVVHGFDAPSSVRATPVRFASRRYGAEGYARLPLTADPFFLGGAANGEELGAFHAAATGRRLANIAAVLDEYVPYGTAAGMVDEG